MVHAQLTLDAASGNFNGALYATTGTFYAMPWRTSDQTTTQVGTASFQPASAYAATLIYTVTTPAALATTVTKQIQRQTLKQIPIVGSYFGGQSGVYSGCPTSSHNGRYADFPSLQVTQSANGSVTFSIMYQGSAAPFQVR